MAIHSPSKGTYSRVSPHSSKHGKLPSPAKGMDARVPMSSNDPSVCIYAFNITPSEYGLSIRKGFREHVIGVDDGLGLGVTTIIPFEGSTSGSSEDRLFAVNNEGIWDVTTPDSLPILKISFPSSSQNAGHGTFCHYIDGADNEFLFYADSLNGLYEYSSALDTWGKPTEITGVDVDEINFVVVHKLRVWFCVKDSPIAWYLPIESKKGVAEPFNYGGKFKHGGNLIGLFNWTVDGGSGVDDILVAVSRAGDVLPYKGADPSSADTWSLVGTYFVGQVPRGPFFGSEHGGELFILSEYGLTSMNDLLKGVDSNALQGVDNAQNSISGAITGVLRDRLSGSINEYGWQVKKAPNSKKVKKTK